MSQSYEVVTTGQVFGASSRTASHNPYLFQAARKEIRTSLIRELGPIRGRWAALWVKDEQIEEALDKAGIYTVNGKFLDAFIEFFKSELGQTLLRILLGIIL